MNDDIDKYLLAASAAGESVCTKCLEKVKSDAAACLDKAGDDVKKQKACNEAANAALLACQAGDCKDVPMTS